MRFSVIVPVPTAPGPPDEVRAALERCARVEALGYDGVWLAPGPADHAPAATLAFAAAILARTRRLRVGLSPGPDAAVGEAGLGQALALVERLATGRLELAAAPEQAGPVLRIAPGRASDPAQPSGPAIDLSREEIEALAEQLWALWRRDDQAHVLLDFAAPEGPPAEADRALEAFSRELLPRFGPQPLFPSTFA